MIRQLIPSVAALLLCAGPLAAQSPAAPATHHDHHHEHGQGHASAAAAKGGVHEGYFADEQVKPRSLSDWEGDWQSVYPYLRDGTLDPVMEAKAKTKGDKTAAAYKAYYETGYKTDVDRIEIHGDTVTFHRGPIAAKGIYAPDGHEILTYAKGNRGVRYSFRKTGGDASAPAFIQFSDHRIAPEKVGHYHLYWGDDRAAVMAELTNWPTYYPAKLDAQGILHEMLAH